MAAIMPGVAKRVAPQFWIFEHMVRMEWIILIVIVIAIESFLPGWSIYVAVIHSAREGVAPICAVICRI